MAKKDYLNFRVIEPETGLDSDAKPQIPEDQDYSNFEVLPGSSVSRQSPVLQVGDRVGKRSKYDTNLTLKDLDNLERERALHQPWTHKAFNSIVGGIASGVLTAAEDVGYMLDFDNNIKRLQGLENVDTNEFSKVMKEMKERLGEKMPIHRESDQVFDWQDPGFYWSSIKGILDSAVGFAIPGMGVSKGVGAVQRGARLGAEALRGMKTVQRAKRVDQYLSMIGSSEKVQQMVNAGLSGYITNFAEGKMMAVEQFENSLTQMEQGLFETNLEHYQAQNTDGQLTPQQIEELAMNDTEKQLEGGKRKEFESIAGEKANQFITRNKMFALTDAVGLHGIYKGKGFTRQLLKEKGLKTASKRFTTLSSDNLILQGAKEGLEEIGQNIFQMEGEYQSMKDAGLNVDDTPEDLAARIHKFATSDQALLEGLMGVFGGGPQRIFTEAASGNLARSSKKQYKQRYQEQQEQIEANKNFVNKKLGYYAQAQALKMQAYATGQDNLAEIIDKSQFLHVARDNFAKGTTENLERQLQDVIDATPEQAKANGWDPMYQEQAQNQLQELKSMEKQYNRFSRYENQNKVFFNRQNRKILVEDKVLIQELRDELQSELELNEGDADLQSVVDTYNKTLTSLDENISELDMEYTDLVSVKTQQEERKKKKDQRDQMQKIQKDLKFKVKKEAEQEKADTRKSKAEAKEQAKKKDTTEEKTVDATDDTVDPFTDSEEEEDKGADEIAPDQLEEEKKQAEITSNVNDATTALTVEGTDKKGLVGNLINLTREAKGREDVTINDVVEEMIDRAGVVATEAAFDALEQAYKEINPDYEITGDFKKFIEPSPDEKRESDGQKAHAETDTKEQYTDKTEENVTKAQEDIENQVQGNDKQSDPTEEVSHTEYSRIKSAAGVLAYLSRVYKRIKGTIEETSDQINSDMLVKDVLDPKKYGPGTKVSLKLEDVDATPAYAEGGTTKETTWGMKKLAWEADPDLTQEQRETNYQEQVPIAVYADGEKIGYLHETEWINESNVSGDVVQDKARNKKIRQFIIDKGELNTTIKSKSSGYLFRSTQGNVKTADAIKENLPIVIGSKGDYKTSRTDVYSTEKLLNKGEPQEGVSYIVIPIGIDSQIAIPLLVDKASEHEEVVNSIMTALDIFFYEKKDEKSDAIVNGILEETGINISTANGITDFLELYLNNYDIGKADDLKTYLKENTSIEQLNNTFMSMRRRDNDMNIQVARGKGVGRIFLSKAYLAKKTKEEQAARFAEIRTMLGNMYLHTSLDHVGKKVVTIDADGGVSSALYNDHIKNITKTPFLSHNIGTKEDPNYVYTIQPVVEMDFSEVEEQEDDIIVEKKGDIWVVTQQGDGVVTQEFDTEEEARKFAEGVNIITGGKITYKEKRAKTDEKKKRLAAEKEEENIPDGYDEYDEGMNPTDTNFESAIATVLKPEQIQEIEDQADIVVENGKVVKGIVIAALGAAKQRQLVDYMRSKIVESLVKDEKSLSGKIYGDINKMFQKNLDKAEKNIQKAKEEGNAAQEAKHTRARDEFKLILDNFGKLTALTNDQVNRIDNIEVTEIGTDEETREEREVSSENWNDSSVFTMTPINGLASEIKWFLSGIRKFKVNNDGVIIPSKNYLGLQETMSFQELYNTLQRITPNLKPDFNEIITVLKDIANDPIKSRTFPFMKELVTKLEAAPQQVKNQFVSGMTNHNVDMRFIMFSQNPKTGVYELVEQQSNANAMSEVVIRDWYINLITNTAQANAQDNSDYILPAEVRDRLWTTYMKWKESKIYPEAEMNQWLQELGILLSAQTFDDLVQGKIKRSGKYVTLANQVQHKDGLFAVLAKNIHTREDASLVSGNRIVEEGVVKNLAKHESLYALYSHSNSHRTGNKTVYSYSQNKFLINRVRELKEFNDGSNPLLDQLSRLSFNGASEWIELLKENGGDNAFQKNFNRWIFSLEPLKKRGTKSRDNAELGKLSEGEIEVAKIGMLQASYSDNSGELNRVIKILYPTTSDKTAVMGLRILAKDLALTREAEIKDESVDALFDALVEPEIRRIRSFQNKKDKGQTPDVQGYNKGAEQFLFLPEINTIPGVFINGDLNPNIGDADITALIKEKIKEYFSNLVTEKLADWKTQGIGENQEYLNGEFMSGNLAKDHNPMRPVDEANRTKAAAADMVFQYMIGNAEIAMTMTGDPALYFKQHKSNRSRAKTDPNYDFVADAKETYINIGKRLAADIAPGYELADATNNRYVQGFGADPKSASEFRFQITKLLDGQEAYDKVKAAKDDKELTEAIRGLESAPYYSIDSADAQEYTVWKEHLYVMKQAGELSDEEYNEAHFALSHGKDISKKILGKVMQPMKPVYADNKIDEKDDVEKRIYIKSSAFPLLPQMTRNSDLDNLRIAMENQGIDRFAFGTAVKVGNVSDPISIFDDNGKIKKADQISFTGSTMQLSRKGFRIQQRVPYDPKKSEINKVTQASKNLFINMLGVEGFEFEGKTLTGAEFQKKYHEIYGELHELERESLYKELNFNEEEETFDKDMLRSLLLKEARERGYPISDQELIQLDTELKFLAFSPSSNKYEALLNSIVTNRVIKLKLPGKSFVLGSEEGFRTLTTEEADKKVADSGIIFTKNWTGKLLPAREINGIRYAAQAIVPWKFRDKEGNIIDISKYTTKKNGQTVIDAAKVPEEVLHLFGMRIPNQGPNSQSWIEIVGFLPEASGDLLIATKDYVVQMGSDFDVDKLYTYQYNTYEHKDGIAIHRSEKIDKKAALQNKIIDIHIAIHKNPAPEVQKQIAAPLGFWELDKLSAEVVELRAERETGDKMFTGLSDKYQRDKFKNATAGKAGVGVFSLDSMFNAIAQGKDMIHMVRDDENKLVPMEVVFGKMKSDGKLSGEYALDGVTYKSDIIAGYQSAAVDNEKEQILDKLNINNHTFKVIKVLNQLGFGEEVPLFLSQDIIIDYVKELDRLGSSLSGYVPDKEQVAFDTVIAMDKYNVEGPVNAEYANEKATPAKMRAYIKNGKDEANYVHAQRGFLAKFVELNEYGKDIQTLQSTINPDSAGLGKSVMESQLKEEQVYRMLKSPIINAKALVGDIKVVKRKDEAQAKADGYTLKKFKQKTYGVKPETINGHAIVYGLFTNNVLWSRLFPYKATGINTLLEKVEDTIAGSDDVQVAAKAERRLAVWKEMKSYIYADEELGLHDSTITKERQRILYDQWAEGVNTKESLATVIRKIKETPFGKNHPFISRLEGKPEKNGNPSTIVFNASTAENPDETTIYASFVDMLQQKGEDGSSPIVTTFNNESYTMRELAQDLILYSYITGGIQEAVQFVKYIPAAYLATLPFMQKLSNANHLTADFGITQLVDALAEYYNVPPFVEQYIQHHTEKVVDVEFTDITDGNSKNVKGLTHFILKEEKVNKVGKIIDFVRRPPAYITMKGQGVESNSRVKLFKHDFKTGRYVQIDTLGSFAASEYNKNTPYQISQIGRNKSTVKKDEVPTGPTPTQTPITKTPAAPIKESDGRDTTILDLAKDRAKSEHHAEGKEKMKSILNEMINFGDNKYYSALAQEVYNNLDLIPESFSFHVMTAPKGEYNAAKVSYGENSLSLYKDKLAGELYNADRVGGTFLHETLHAMTGYKIRLYQYEQDSSPTGENALNEYIAFTGASLTDNERKVIKSIEVLMNQAKQTIVGKNKEAYEAYKAKIAAKQALTPEELSKFYGFEDISEFVSQALSDEDFQKLLNNIEAPSKKTFWQSLKERLIKLIKAFDFDVKEGSVLEYTLSDVLDLFSKGENTYRGIPIEEGEFKTATGEPGAAQYDKEKNVIRINNTLLSEKYEAKAWTTPREQKDGTFATALKEDTFSSFEEWKSFVIEHEYQHSQIKRQEIEGTGFYEDRINKAALKNIYLSNRDGGLKDSNFRAVVTDEEVEEQIKRCK